jgi:cytoskeletal protein CcmA (bactofilin family)
VFFRNKKGKYTDVEGYNRISRLIEDRQRDVPDSTETDIDFDDEGVLLTREPTPRERGGVRTPEESSSVSTVRPIYRSNEENAGTPSLEDDRRVPFQPDSVTDLRRQPAIEAGQAVAEPVPQAPAPPTAIPSVGNACFVSAEAVWEGKLSTAGDLRVDGTLNGEVEIDGTLFVSANARIDGVVHARSLVLAGEVEGQVRCSERLEILSGGRAKGEIETASLVVHEGAFIDSRFQMKRAGTTNRG